MHHSALWCSSSRSHKSRHEGEVSEILWMCCATVAIVTVINDTMQNHTWISWIVLSRAWIAGEKYTNRLPFECLLAFAASDKIWCPALSTNRNSPVSMKPDLSSSQAWATCGAMERSRHKFQKPHSYTLYSQLIECYRILINIVIYLSYMWFFHVALIDSQWMCRMFTASWPRTLSDPSVDCTINLSAQTLII